jgi:hypothetical protein
MVPSCRLVKFATHSLPTFDTPHCLLQRSPSRNLERIIFSLRHDSLSRFTAFRACVFLKLQSQDLKSTPPCQLYGARVGSNDQNTFKKWLIHIFKPRKSQSKHRKPRIYYTAGLAHLTVCDCDVVRHLDGSLVPAKRKHCHQRDNPSHSNRAQRHGQCLVKVIVAGVLRRDAEIVLRSELTHVAGPRGGTFASILLTGSTMQTINIARTKRKRNLTIDSQKVSQTLAVGVPILIRPMRDSIFLVAAAATILTISRTSSSAVVTTKTRLTLTNILGAVSDTGTLVQAIRICLALKRGDAWVVGGLVLALVACAGPNTITAKRTTFGGCCHTGTSMQAPVLVIRAQGIGNLTVGTQKVACTLTKGVAVLIRSMRDILGVTTASAILTVFQTSIRAVVTTKSKRALTITLLRVGLLARAIVEAVGIALALRIHTVAQQCTQ